MKTRRRIKKSVLIVIFLILIFAVFGSLYAFSGYFKKDVEVDTPTELNKKETKKVYSSSFTLAGNVLVNSNMWYDTLSEDNTYNFKYVFETLKKSYVKSNINFYSEQSIIGGKDLGLSAYYNYNSPVEVGDAMIDLGINLVSLANYHAYDKGLKGITNSIEYWNKNKIAYSGTSTTEEERLQNNIIAKNGVSYALLSYTLGTDTKFTDKYLINVYSDEQVKEDVNRMKQLADVVIVSIDWSEIKQAEVTSKQKEIATYLSELGVNVIIGNTGYSIQPIEKINDTLVFYSLGNLLSAHTLVDSRISMIPDFDIILTEIDGNKTITFDNINVMLTFAYNKNNTGYKVIPLKDITTELKDYKTYYEKYKTILTKDKDYVKVYDLGE